MNISDALEKVMKDAGLPLTMEGVIRAKAALSAMPQSDLVRRLEDEADRVINSAMNCYSQHLDNQLKEEKKRSDARIAAAKQHYENEQNARNNEAYRTALAKATDAIKSYKKNPNSFMADLELRSLKFDLNLYGGTLFLDSNLENQYKSAVNEILKQKGVEFTL